MKTIALLTILVFIPTFSVYSQSFRGTEIRDRDIEWSDFTGKIDESSKHDAWTYWVTTYSFGPPIFFGDTARINITVRLFLRSDSWVKPEKRTARLLNHERGHYRIGRICSNEIESAVNSMDFSRSNYRAEVDAVYWKIINKYREINKLYDLETEHYNNRQQQSVWDKKLEELLGK